MTEAHEELVKELERKQEERRVLMESAKRDKDRDLETYHADMIAALDKALHALKER